MLQMKEYVEEYDKYNVVYESLIKGKGNRNH